MCVGLLLFNIYIKINQINKKKKLTKTDQVVGLVRFF